MTGFDDDAKSVTSGAAETADEAVESAFDEAAEFDAEFEEYNAEREAEEEGADQTEHYQLSPEELRQYRRTATLTALGVGLIFAIVFGLFIAFCDFIWFR